ncbi:hypothetical protein PG994_003322 [Apiospora phragmitis]|uniref:Uncharacterized protein n=1 Tax=Apiospora phragmitis TaxID=2905665 RepID=A0ABR1VXR1_9PEZI
MVARGQDQDQDQDRPWPHFASPPPVPALRPENTFNYLRGPFQGHLHLAPSPSFPLGYAPRHDFLELRQIDWRPPLADGIVRQPPPLVLSNFANVAP